MDLLLNGFVEGATSSASCVLVTLDATVAKVPNTKPARPLQKSWVSEALHHNFILVLLLSVWFYFLPIANFCPWVGVLDLEG